MTGLRIVEATPPATKASKAKLEHELQSAALELALEFAAYVPGKAIVACCFKCGWTKNLVKPVPHYTHCPVGRVIALAEALSDLRMLSGPSELELGPAPALTSEDHRFIEPYHVEYEVPEHPWAGEEGNCPALGRPDRPEAAR